MAQHEFHQKTKQEEESISSNTLLSSLVVPGTPQSIETLYASLAQEAKTCSFGLLEEDLVVLDTETTGLSFKDDELIEIAAARISGREISDAFKTFVKPRKKIPEEITALTSIRNEDVADAPTAEEAVSALAEFCAGSPVIAHNATFDKTFIESTPGGAAVSSTWIDSLALSRIALPRLKSHSLSVLAETFELAGVSHRAMDDVEALVGLWRILLLALTKFGAGFLSTLAHMHPEVEWPYRFIFSYLHADVSGTQDTNAKTPFSLLQTRADVLRAQPVEPRDDAREKVDTLLKIDETGIQTAYSKDGVVGFMYEDYEPRFEQAKMAEAVVRALNNQENLAVEAGTGVGKSIAYMLPLTLYARQNNVTCGVATKSIALTDQLMQKELPALSQVLAQQDPAQFPHGIQFASLKGYEHYPCLRKVERAISAPLPLEFVENGVDIAAVDQLNAIAVILANACQAPEGDLDGLGIRWRNVPKSLVSSPAEECLKKKCPYFLAGCPLHGARRRAAAADIVITNHSLLLRDIAAEGNILPPISQWVIDEAHSFAHEARHQWALEASAPALRTAFERLGGLRTGLIHALLVQLKSSEAAVPVMGLLTKASHELERTMIASADFFESVADLIGENKTGPYSEVHMWLGSEIRATMPWEHLSCKGKGLIERLEALINTLSEAEKLMLETLPSADANLADSIAVLREQREALRLVIEGEDEAYAYSLFGRTGKGQRGSEKLLAEPIDVGESLAEQFYPQTLSVVYCSATIAVGDSFEHFESEVGLDKIPRELTQTLRLASPFAFDENMAVIFANDMPSHQDGGYYEKLGDVLYDIHCSMEGSVLTLFTNRRDMERIYQDLEPRLRAAGLELEQQSRREAAWRLQKRFVANKKMSLFALKSFWEGIDAQGDTLRCVVVPKLPFANPNDPLVRERAARDQGSWFKHCLPEAVLNVKQAAGRLIRSTSDTGILVVCDERIITKRYGQEFRKAMPSTAQSDLSTDAIGEYVRLWRSSHEAR